MQENIPLKPYTSLYVGGNARYFTEAHSIEKIKESIEFSKQKIIPLFILGGGSNVLVSDSGFNGLVIKVSILGIEKINEDSENVFFEVGAGEGWDSFVEFAVNEGLFGIENLSHIPGTVGASVVQNIGAYGQEVSATVSLVKVLNIETLTEEVWKNEEMDFSYRKSRLNDTKKDKGKFVVTSIVFCLKKKGELNINYVDLKKYFSENSLKLNLRNVRQAVIKVRDQKFPYPDSPEHGTVGSFWNAEVINEKIYENIILKLKEMGFKNKADEMINKKSVFTVSQGYKVPYGVLVEVLGFKGKVFGKAKILETHSCVINNFTGEATAEEIMEISNKVLEVVHKEFGVKMKVEPELVGNF